MFLAAPPAVLLLLWLRGRIAPACEAESRARKARRFEFGQKLVRIAAQKFHCFRALCRQNHAHLIAVGEQMQPDAAKFLG